MVIEPLRVVCPSSEKADSVRRSADGDHTSRKYTPNTQPLQDYFQPLDTVWILWILETMGKKEEPDIVEYFEEVVVPKAIRRVEELLDSENEKIRLETSQGVLNRDKRFNLKSEVASQTLVLNVPTEHISKALDGVRRVLTNDTQEVEVSKVESKSKAVHGKRVDRGRG